MNYQSLLETLDSVFSEVEHSHAAKMTPLEWQALELRRDRLSLVLDRLEAGTKQDLARRVS